MNQKPDYGPKGCCGPIAFAMLTVLLAGAVALVGWFA